MKLLLLALALLFSFSSCSHTARTKYSDPHLRIAVWPLGIDSGNYVKITQALISSGKFIVIDRGEGLAAVEKEQETLHQTQSDRFDDKEKFAHFGKLFGTGAILIAHTQCAHKHAFIVGSMYLKCQQFAEIVNSNTGEVMASAEGEESTSNNEEEIAPEWNDTIDRLIAAYPEHYEPNRDTKELVDYKDLSKEEAQRARERKLSSEVK